jgi:predicted enzyme related to lactoylglutathione lyase
MVRLALTATGSPLHPTGGTTMNGSHVHVGVTDLPAAVRWLETVWDLRPTFCNDHMAVLPFGGLALIVDASPANTAATIAFESANCDEDFNAIKQRGGIVLEEPINQSWGVRVARIQGPGALTFEIEQASPGGATTGESDAT